MFKCGVVSWLVDAARVVIEDLKISHTIVEGCWANIDFNSVDHMGKIQRQL